MQLSAASKLVMAPTTNSTLKRKANDDFVFTISDNEDDFIPDLDTEVLVANFQNVVSNKKRKQGGNESSKSASKRQKKQKDQKTEAANPKSFSRRNDEEEEDNTGIWGTKDEDDGAMDSDFDFQLEGAIADGGMGDFDGWGFEDAKRALDSTKAEENGGRNKRAVDIDEIIARRKAKTADKAKDGNIDENTEEEDEEEANEENEETAVELDSDFQDEFMAEDGFGMGAGSDEEESEEEMDKKEGHDQRSGQSEQDDSSDEESVASEVPHPNDLEEASSNDESEDEDQEEAVRRKAFFAPEEETLKDAQANGSITFQNMSLSRPILRGLATVGFSQPTPIQVKTIPIALLGKDVVGSAVTGSGKTAAFVVPILERLFYRPKKVPTSRVVILMPTRELAIQCHAVATKLASYTDIKFCLAVGGLSLKMQEAELRLRPDVIIATPGRFIDHMRNSASFTVDTLEILVLDEADRMLEDGFADELNEILTSIPKARQTMLFSATMTSSVDNLIRVGLNRPVRLMVDAQKQIVGTLVQEFVRLRPGREDKRMGYLLYLCSEVYTDKVIVFFRQKKEAHRARIIFGLSGLKAAELHGSMSQEQRIISVEAFRDGKVSFLLATDLASRGLDIRGVDAVINFEAPQSHEIYLHRVGRTARAGRSGRACTLAAETDRKVVKAAVKSSRTQGAKIAGRVIEAAEADLWAEKVKSMQEEIEEILQEEKEDKQLAQAEMQVRKGENIIAHEDEIKARPKRTWFESEKEKKIAKKAGRAELNGQEGMAKKKKEGKLSNKDKKKLDDQQMRMQSKVWKKGKAEREGNGIFTQRKGKGKKVKGGKSVDKRTASRAKYRD